MPTGIQRKLIGHFAIGAALGSLMAAALLAGETAIANVVWRTPAPHFTASIVAACFIAYCGVGATLSGFLLIKLEE